MLLFRKIKSYLLQNTSTKQTIVKNTFRLLIAEWVSKGSLFLISILIARQLGPEQFGVMSFVISFVSLFIVFTDFGLTTLMVREVSRDQSKLAEYFVNGNFLKILLGIVTFWIVWWVSQFIGKSDLYIILILIYCGYAIVNNIGDFIRSFFRPSEHMQYEATLKIINGLLAILIVWGTLWLWYGLQGIFYAYLISGLISLLISIWFVIGKHKIQKTRFLEKSILFSNMKSGFFLLWWLIFIQIYVNIDQVMLWLYGFTRELWVYSAMYKFIFLATTISQLFVFAIIPNILKNYSFSKVLKTLKILLIFAVFCVLFILFFWKYFINIIYGKDYLSWYFALIILWVTYIFISMNHLLYLLLNSLKFEKVILVFTIISWLVNLLLNLYLIPLYRSEWAALTTLIAEVILFLLIVARYYRTLKNYKLQ